MTFDDIKEMQIGSKKVKEAWLNGKQVYPSKKRIMDSLVCWYDIGKQQCTNESMASNPVLADLSGNGHDITCYNFGWSGMSGIGGYNWAYNTFVRNTYFEHTDNTVILEHSDNTIFEHAIILKNTTFNNSVVKGQKFSVNGMADGARFEAYISIVGAQSSVALKSTVTKITQNGEYSVPDLDISELENINYIYFGFRNISIPEGVTVTIENIPLYPNALVSDGVDDYCYTDGLPILTDYTVIAKRKWLADNISTNNNACIAIKGFGGTEHAFIFERLDWSGRYMEFNFNAYNNITLYADEITYCTKHSYNGQSIIAGTSVDTDDLRLYGLATGSDKAKAALYSFLLFDRTLTTAEIEWVKQNMIESGGC